MEPIFAADRSGCSKGLVEDYFFKHPISSLTVFQPVGGALYRCVGGIPGIDAVRRSIGALEGQHGGILIQLGHVVVILHFVFGLHEAVDLGQNTFDGVRMIDLEGRH